MLKTVAIIFLSLGMIMLVVGYVMPPMGVIDGSVVSAFGEILGAVGILLAWHSIDRALDNKSDIHITHGDTTIKVDN